MIFEQLFLVVGAAAPVLNEPEGSIYRIASGIEETTIPAQIPVGRRMILLKNTGSEEFQYIFSSVKRGYSVEDFKDYTEAAYVNQSIPVDPATAPATDIWGVARAPGEETRLNIDVKEKKYVITGPISPAHPLKDQWRGDSMFHVMQEVPEQK